MRVSFFRPALQGLLFGTAHGEIGTRDATMRHTAPLAKALRSNDLRVWCRIDGDNEAWSPARPAEDVGKGYRVA